MYCTVLSTKDLVFTLSIESIKQGYGLRTILTARGNCEELQQNRIDSGEHINRLFVLSLHD